MNLYHKLTRELLKKSYNNQTKSFLPGSHMLENK